MGALPPVDLGDLDWMLRGSRLPDELSDAATGRCLTCHRQVTAAGTGSCQNVDCIRKDVVGK